MPTRRRGRIGRPREFDPDEALERAMLVFWEHGYEGASLAMLTRAMGISTTSMYAAFGNKEELFRKALRHYTKGPAAYLGWAVEEPTARGVATALLVGVVHATTRPDGPRGCLGVQGALASGDSGREAQDMLVAWRADAYARLRERFRRAADEGDLPAETDPALLARYVSTLAFGIAVQAASGAEPGELRNMVDAVLRRWPPV